MKAGRKAIRLQPVDAPVKPKAPITDPLLVMLGHELRRTSVAVMNTLAERLTPLGLNPGEASLLLVIGVNDGVTQSDLARALRAQPANLQPLVHKLWQSGTLERAPGKGRAITLSLSAEGRALHERVARVFDRHEAQITRNIPPERREEMISLLREICHNACCVDAG